MNKASRIGLTITGALAGLVATALIAGGAIALIAQWEKDDGYVTTNQHRFAADTRALATGNLDLDIGGQDSVLSTDDLGKVRLEATSPDGKPLFVGIARTTEAQRYLSDVPYTSVDDVRAGPFESFDADYTRHGGRRHPVAPEHAGIWAASAQGSGRQTVDWEVEDGDWSVVVMNADGSLGVDADISAGASLPFLDELGWTALGSGVFALVAAIALIAPAIRRPRGPSGHAPVGDAAPAAA